MDWDKIQKEIQHQTAALLSSSSSNSTFESDSIVRSSNRQYSRSLPNAPVSIISDRSNVLDPSRPVYDNGNALNFRRLHNEQNNTFALKSDGLDRNYDYEDITAQIEFENNANISSLMRDFNDMKRTLANQAKKIAAFEKLAALHNEDLLTVGSLSESIRDKVGDRNNSWCSFPVLQKRVIAF